MYLFRNSVNNKEVFLMGDPNIVIDLVNGNVTDSVNLKEKTLNSKWEEFEFSDLSGDEMNFVLSAATNDNEVISTTLTV